MSVVHVNRTFVRYEFGQVEVRHLWDARRSRAPDLKKNDEGSKWSV